MRPVWAKRFLSSLVNMSNQRITMRQSIMQLISLVTGSTLCCYTISLLNRGQKCWKRLCCLIVFLNCQRPYRGRYSKWTHCNVKRSNSTISMEAKQNTAQTFQWVCNIQWNELQKFSDSDDKMIQEALVSRIRNHGVSSHSDVIHREKASQNLYVSLPWIT